MSGMADEMARRIAADGGTGLADAGAVPGSEGSPPETVPPAAEPSTTDTGAGSGPPDTIPYTRFKEVNDRYNELKGFEELVQYGYDADSLRRLAAFEAGYLQDPVGTWKQMADNLDLPQPVMEAIQRELQASASQGGSAEGEPSTGTPTTTPELSPEIKARLDYVDQLQAREAEAQNEANLQAVVRAWDDLDKKDSIETPERIKLMAIAATAQGGGDFRTYEELAAQARSSILDYRSGVLGSVVQGTGRTGAPPALPGSTPAPTEPIKFKDFRDASRAAEAAIARGELPGLNP